MQTLVRDGVALRYEESGDGPDPFLFIPGGSCDWWSFHRQLARFGRSHRCVSVDLRGHGTSDRPEQAYTMAGFADDVAWLAGQLGIERPVVVGHSMGGAITLQLLADGFDARAAVLVDPAPVHDNRAGFEKMLASFDRFGVDSTRRRAFRNFFLPGADETLIEAVLDHAALTADHVFRSEIEGLLRWDGSAVATAARGRAPVLHIAATHPTCPPSALRAVLPEVVTGQTVGAGHFNMLEVPEQVDLMIAAFLRQYAS